MANGRVSAFGFIATVQAYLLLLFTIFLILHSYCVVNFFENSFLSVMIKTLYFHDPGLCGENINIGTLVDGIADQAFIAMQHVPFTYNRTLNFIWGNFGVVFFSLIANELMFRNWSTVPWLIVSLVASLLDFSAILIYLNETNATKTLPETMKYIGATSFGTGNVTLDTASVAPVMSLIMSKCVLFLIINCALIVWYALDRKFQYKKHVKAIAAAENPVSPAHFAPETIDGSPQSLPRPSLYRNDRFVATLRQDIEAGCARASPDLTSGLRQSEPTLPLPQRAFSAEDVRIRVPDALLSLPQRLERIIADEARNLETANDLGENNQTHESGKTRGVLGQGSILFPECTLTLPRELEQTMKHQKRWLDKFTYTFKVQHKHNNPLSVSLHNLTVDLPYLLYPSPNEDYQEYKVWWMPDYTPGTRLDHLGSRVEPFRSFNVTGLSGSVSRTISVDSVLYSRGIRHLVFYPSQRQEPDVLY